MKRLLTALFLLAAIAGKGQSTLPMESHGDIGHWIGNLLTRDTILEMRINALEKRLDSLQRRLDIRIRHSDSVIPFIEAKPEFDKPVIFDCATCPMYWEDWLKLNDTAAMHLLKVIKSVDLPSYAQTSNGIILNAHTTFKAGGVCLYDGKGRLLRTQKGRCDSIETVYDHGKWVPYSQCSYCKPKKKRGKP